MRIVASEIQPQYMMIVVVVVVVVVVAMIITTTIGVRGRHVQ